MAASKFKTETLLKRLERYDSKYHEQISTPHGHINFGYGMRAYHALKNFNPPEFKTREKARDIADELTKRRVKFHTTFLKLSN